MSIIHIYKKSITVFSRSRQEEIINTIEHEFYEAITVYGKEPYSFCRLHMKLEKVCNSIRDQIANYYFEDDLLDHMFSLLNFIINYIQELERTSCPTKISGPKKAKLYLTK